MSHFNGISTSSYLGYTTILIKMAESKQQFLLENQNEIKDK